MWREGLRPPDPFARRRPPLEEARTQDGMSLATLSAYGPVLAVCLPALGTPACRDQLVRIAEERAAIERDGTRVVLIHMASDDDAAQAEFARHDLQYLARVADPGQTLYDHFGLGHSTRAQRLSPAALLRALAGAGARRHPIHGDPTRLSGRFLLRDGRIEERG